MTNPVDEYLEETEKTAAGLGTFMRAMGGSLKDTVTNPTQLGAALGVTGLGLGLEYGGRAAQKALGAMTKRTDFKEMLQANPDLAEHHESNPEQFNRHYTTLRSLAPRYAADPIISGTFMRRMSMNPQNAGYTALELLGARSPQPGPDLARRGSDFFGAGNGPRAAHIRDDQYQRGLAREEFQADTDGMNRELLQMKLRRERLREQNEGAGAPDSTRGY